MHIKSSRVGEPTKPILIYDSGAQHTVVSDIELLSNHTECEQPFLNGNETISVATRIGDLVLNGQGIKLTIHQVLYSGDLGYNLITTWDLANQGHEVPHNTEEFWIRVAEGGEKMVIATSPGDHLFWGSPELSPLEAEQLVDLGSVFQQGNTKWIDEQQFGLMANIRIPTIPDPFGPKDMVYYHLMCGHASYEAPKDLKKLKIIRYKENTEDRQLLKSCRVCQEVNLAKPHNKGSDVLERLVSHL